MRGRFLDCPPSQLLNAARRPADSFDARPATIVGRGSGYGTPVGSRGGRWTSRRCRRCLPGAPRVALVPGLDADGNLDLRHRGPEPGHTVGLQQVVRQAGPFAVLLMPDEDVDPLVECVSGAASRGIPG